MTFKITIKELHEAVVDVEAKTYKQAIEQIESDYWENPTIIYSNRKILHLNNEKPLLTEGLNFK